MSNSRENLSRQEIFNALGRQVKIKLKDGNEIYCRNPDLRIECSDKRVYVRDNRGYAIAVIEYSTIANIVQLGSKHVETIKAW